MDNSLIGAILDMNIPYMFAYCVTCGTPVALLAALAWRLWRKEAGGRDTRYTWQKGGRRW